MSRILLINSSKAVPVNYHDVEIAPLLAGKLRVGEQLGHSQMLNTTLSESVNLR
jgi:hypothetical protein